MTLYLGTSGFAYPEWRPDFYPKGLPPRRFLEHYGTVFNAVEINSTFYSRKDDSVLHRWAGSVPDGFRFALKAHRLITHGRSIAPEGNRAGYLAGFIASAEALGPKRGPLLFQFPPHRERDEEALRTLMSAIPPHLDYALEFRHGSWDGIEATVAASGATTCLADGGGDPPLRLPPGPFAYIRLRGDSYTPEQRQAWVRLISTEDRDVYLFAKHEGVPPNDIRAGVGMAVELARSQVSL